MEAVLIRKRFILSIILVLFDCSVYDPTIIDATNGHLYDSQVNMPQDGSVTNRVDAADGTDLQLDSKVDSKRSHIDANQIVDTDEDTSTIDVDTTDADFVDADTVDVNNILDRSDADCDEDLVEVCNGIDDDCDGETDEEPAHSSCQLDHATAICDNHVCVVDECEKGWRNCDSDNDNGCEFQEDSESCPVLHVLFMPSEGDLKWIRLQLIIDNKSEYNIAISDISLRYYYTVDSDSLDQSFSCWNPSDETDCSSGLCCKDHIVGTISSIDGTDADHFLELSFLGSKEILAGDRTDIISVGVHKDSWEEFDYTNDYSYEAFTDFSESERITLHLRGQLVSGVEP